MTTHWKRSAMIETALVVLVGGALALSQVPRLVAGLDRAELADPPFSKVPDNFPRFIPVREAPSRDDKLAFEAYLKERKAIHQFLTETGAISRVTPEEREAVVAALNGNYTKAKSLGLKVLARDKNSIAALYAAAMARVAGDANLGDGLFLIRRARQTADRLGRANPTDADAREWYLRTLSFEEEVLVQLGRDEEALRAIEILERLYEPLPRMKIWRLFKLKRLDEAEAALEQAEKSGRFQRSTANDRLALEGLRLHRVESLDAGRVACRVDQDSPVVWSNTGEAAESCFRHDEAEKAYQTSLELGIRSRLNQYNNTPLTPLSRIQVRQGRLSEALDSLRQGRAQRALRKPGTLANDQGEYDQAVALALLSLGRAEDAERFARRAIETPDRLGHNSDRPDDRTLSHAVILWTVLAARQAQQEEQGHWDWASSASAIEARTTALLASSIIRQGDRPNILRPYLPCSPVVASWQLGSILRMVRPGVGLAMLDQARNEETHPDAVPYFDALEAEARWLAGDAAGALPVARKALDRLPRPAERLLRGRTAAIAAEVARQLGRNDESRELWSASLVEFPAAPRLLGLAVPVKIEAGTESSALVDLLTRSHRLRAESWGLPLRILAGNGRLSVILLRGDGSTHAELTQPLGTVPTDADNASVRDRFLDLLASPTIQLSATEINAFDGLPGQRVSSEDQAAIAQIGRDPKPGNAPK